MGIGGDLKEGQERGREEARKRLIIADDPFIKELDNARKEIEKLTATPLNELKASQDPSCTGGRKFDGGKLEYDLLPPTALENVVQVLMFGAEKYEIDNWRRVPNAKRRYWNAAQRHMWAYKNGEQTDPETGVHHLAHAVCCLMFINDLDNTGD